MPRRSPYADLLKPFAGKVIFDHAVTRQRGLWREHFAARARRSPDSTTRSPDSTKRLPDPASGSTDPARRLILDVGCNDGVLLAAIAARHPDCDFIGLDWSPRLLFHAAARVAREANVTLLHARAEDLTTIFGPGELDEIWLFQPEPMQLTTRTPTRLFDEPFLLDCAKVLKPGGLLTLKTDHPGYYQWAAGRLGIATHSDFAAQLSGEVKAKRKEFADGATVTPQPSDAARQAFRVTANSAHYWQDAAAIEHTRGRAYAGEISTYERRFHSRQLPIYLLELTAQPT